MATVILPLIERDDYKAFKTILGPDLPNTYDEWLNLHTNESTNYLKAAIAIRVVKVNPSDFTAFCAGRSHAPNLKALADLAIEEAARHDKDRYPTGDG